MRVLAGDPCSGLPALVSASPTASTAPRPALGLAPPPPGQATVTPDLAAHAEGL